MPWKLERRHSDAVAQNTEMQLDFLFFFSSIKPPIWHVPKLGDKEQ